MATTSRKFGADRLGAADALDLPFLDRPQQLGLQVEAEIADLVEEQRAAGRASSNLPSCCLCAPVNAPRSWPNSVLSTSSCGMADRLTAMNGASLAARLAVQQPREQLLARAALAEDQHRRRQLRHLVHEIDDVADLLARADQELALALLGDLRAEGDDLAVEILPLAGVAHERPQLVVVEVLGDVVIGAVLHRLHGGLDLVDRRDHDALDQAVVLLDDPQHVEAADAREPDVEQDQIDVFLLEQRQRGLAAGDRQDAVVPARIAAIVSRIPWSSSQIRMVLEVAAIGSDEDCSRGWRPDPIDTAVDTEPVR